MANRMNTAATNESRLGGYLKDRRSKLDPTAFGFAPERRRTPGLRREEVAAAREYQPDLVHVAGAGARRSALR
jgi:hypothetical protein